MAVENRLEALCFVRSPSGGLVALNLAESCQIYVRGIALSLEPPKLQQAFGLFFIQYKFYLLYRRDPYSCRFSCSQEQLMYEQTENCLRLDFVFKKSVLCTNFSTTRLPIFSFFCKPPTRIYHTRLPNYLFSCDSKWNVCCFSH